MMTVTRDSYMQTFPNLPHQQSKNHAPGIKLALWVYEQALGSKTTIGEHAVKKHSMMHRATLIHVHICTYCIYIQYCMQTSHTVHDTDNFSEGSRAAMRR